MCHITLCSLTMQVKDTYTVNDQPHYQFNPRDVTDWIKGLQWCVCSRTMNALVAAYMPLTLLVVDAAVKLSVYAPDHAPH